MKGDNNMSSSQTPNYGLSQWEKTDQVLMEEFNADNLKIDEALKAAADARAALTTQVGQKANQSALTTETNTRNSAVNTINATLAKKGNCEIWAGSYSGTGTYGYDKMTSFTFPKLPLFAVIIGGSEGEAMILTPGCNRAYAITNNNRRITIVWSGTTASWYTQGSTPQEQMNAWGTYHVFAFYKAD